MDSAASREHGLRLEREAEALHGQSAQIAEAERLEQEAKEHRERAVASGADYKLSSLLPLIFVDLCLRS